MGDEQARGRDSFLAQWSGYASIALRLGALACVLLAIVGGLRGAPVAATVPTLLQSATVLLLTAIVVLLDDLRTDLLNRR